jgi:hypothetical protein
MSVSCHAMDTIALSGKGGTNGKPRLAARAARNRNAPSYGVGKFGLLSESGASTRTP